jgi:hypothetical protein
VVTRIAGAAEGMKPVTLSGRMRHREARWFRRALHCFYSNIK